MRWHRIITMAHLSAPALLPCMRTGLISAVFILMFDPFALGFSFYPTLFFLLTLKIPFPCHQNAKGKVAIVGKPQHNGNHISQYGYKARIWQGKIAHERMINPISQ